MQTGMASESFGNTGCRNEAVLGTEQMRVRTGLRQFTKWKAAYAGLRQEQRRAVGTQWCLYGDWHVCACQSPAGRGSAFGGK